MLGLRSLWLQHVHDETDKRVFLCRGRFGDKQGQGSEAGVVDDGLTVSAQQTAVAVQEIHEQEGAATFVAIGKGVLLHHEIEQVRCLAFASGIGGSAENALFEVTKRDGETVFPLTSEEFSRLAARDELLFEGMQRGARILAHWAECRRFHPTVLAAGLRRIAAARGRYGCSG